MTRPWGSQEPGTSGGASSTATRLVEARWRPVPRRAPPWWHRPRRRRRPPPRHQLVRPDRGVMLGHVGLDARIVKHKDVQHRRSRDRGEVLKTASLCQFTRASTRRIEMQYHTKIGRIPGLRSRPRMRSDVTSFHHRSRASRSRNKSDANTQVNPEATAMDVRQ